jgi:adenine phosphoribosyltransferase
MITLGDSSKEIERCAFDVKNSIEDVADFPIPGVTFKDLGPLWRNASLSERAIKALVDQVESTVGIPDCVVGIESRGFIFGPAMALHWGVPFVPFRKPGKLPGAVSTVSYDLEYGSAELQCQVGSISPQMKVLIHDDVLATGGTASAAISLVQSFSAVVSACSFLIELEALGARKTRALSNEDVTCLSLVKYK